MLRVQKAIINVLMQYPEGITVNQLAKLASIPPMTLRYHIDRFLFSILDVQDVHIGNRSRPYLRIVRLKKNALSKSNLLLQRLMREYD